MNMRIVDSHTHLEFNKTKALLAAADHFGFEKFGVMATPCCFGALNTLECMLMKRANPGRVYCYGGMVYLPGLQATAAEHEKQLELMMNAGCDGWKILESKASDYRKLQLPLDGEVFSRAFAMAESENIPITWHCGDPAIFWDAEKAPAVAVERGWLCIGEGFPSLEQLYAQVENVLARHPKLRVSMAHLYFTSDDRPHAERLLDAYENFWLDMTPGTEMYPAFLADPEGWKAFFARYQDKLVFGTDSDDNITEQELRDCATLFDLVRQVLIGNQPFVWSDISGTGLGLAPEILEKIFAGNFERRAGKQPRPMSDSGIEAYADWLLPKLSSEDRKAAEALLGR